MTKKYKIFLCGALLLGLVNCQTTKPVQTTYISPLTRQPSAALRSETQGPIDDCLDHAYLYARYDGLKSECTMNYVHYYSEKTIPTGVPEGGKLRIGSFNLFHLGDNQSSLKNFALTAEIMNQWDVVGAQELMPLPTEQAISNHAICSLIIQSGDNNDYIKRKLQVDRPGYLILLNELRRLDPSWSLILQPMAEGDGSSGEMAGFYYRKAVVQLRDCDYCPAERSIDLKSQNPTKSYGCLAQIPPEQQKLVSRRAFVTYFQSGKFDFIGMTAHVRFRAADLESDLRLQENEICQNHEDPKKCKPTKDNVGRYYEVKAVADQIDSIQRSARDKDVIYMGDFNVEYNTKTISYWKAALKSAEGFFVYQNLPTTLAVQRESLLSNYDHFIFNPKITTQCSPESVKPYDFTSSKTPTNALQEKIADAASPVNVQKQIEKRMGEIENFAKAKVNKDNSILVSNLDQKEVDEYKNRFAGTVERMKKNHVGAMLELISDHIPIEMECQTNGESK